MMQRLTKKQVRGLGRSNLGRQHLLAVLETHQGALGSVTSLIALGADTPANLRTRATVEHNIKVLQRALGEI